jgi:Cu(I)/Ag(I) efflux system membrane fusion protein
MTVRTRRRRLIARMAASLSLLALLGIAALLLRQIRGGGRGAEAPAASFEGAGLRVEVALEPPMPRPGRNEFRFRVRDEAGAPVSDAEVGTRYSMSMAGQPSMSGRAAARPMGDGEYRADLELEMSGTWRLAIEAKRPSGEIARAEGSLTTGTMGVRLEGVAVAGKSPSPPDDELSHYTCSMHTSVREKGPGQCPICGMDLVPVTKREVMSGEIRIDSERRQRIGIRSAPVRRLPLEQVVRAVGRVTWDETGLVDVSLKVRGWVRRLDADALGKRVRGGEPLFALYSPELYAAQQELLQALRSQEAARETGAPERADELVRAARTRLRLWDASESEIDALARRGAPFEELPIRSPASGFVIEKNVVEGSAVEPGTRLFRIAPLDRVWIEAQLYESDLELVAVGQVASVTFPYLPGQMLEAKVAYLYPYLEGDTRTARIRLELPNPELQLRPDMYANVELRVDRGERLVVPESAVIYAGPRRLVFLDLGDGRLDPREIEIGIGNGEVYEVLSGLEEGQQVVVSGNFLVAAESRLKSALETW